MLTFDEVKSLTETERANLESPVIRSLIGVEGAPDTLITFTEAKALSNNQGTNLESVIIRTMIEKNQISFSQAKNLTRTERKELRKDETQDKLNTGKATLEDVLKNLRVVDAATNIIVLKDKIKSFEDEEKAELKGRESAMSDRSVIKADLFFKNKIKPYFEKEFETFGATHEERINTIEKNIRTELLNQIENTLSYNFDPTLDKKKENDLPVIVKENKEGKEEKEKEVKEAPVITNNDAINFLKANREALINGDAKAMEESRNYFTSRLDSAQAAWRGYDPQAPRRGAFPSFFVALQNTGETWNSGGQSDKESSDTMRERAAYYFLAANDLTNPEDKAEALLNFTNSISGIIRDKNEDDITKLDEPSCYPGNVTRLAQGNAKHPATKLPKDTNEWVKEILEAKISLHFKGQLAALPDDESKEQLFNALIMLNQENAKEIHAKPQKFSTELLNLRDTFIASLGGYEKIIAEVSQKLVAETGKPLLKNERIYVDYMLANIGGETIVPTLTDIYRKSIILKPEEIKVKKEFNEIKTVHPFPLQSLEKTTASQGMFKNRAAIEKRALNQLHKHQCYNLFLPLVEKCLTDNDLIKTVKSENLTDLLKSLVENSIFERNEGNQNPIEKTLAGFKGKIPDAIITALTQISSPLSTALAQVKSSDLPKIAEPYKVDGNTNSRPA